MPTVIRKLEIQVEIDSFLKFNQTFAIPRLASVIHLTEIL